MKKITHIYHSGFVCNLRNRSTGVFHEMNLAKDMSKDIKSAEHDTQSAMNK